MGVNYDIIAEQYRNYRIPDSRIESAIRAHFINAKRVLNVGAGLGAYEPENCELVALEPSEEMIALRPPGKSPAVRGYAEDLPFKDNEFDVSMAILTLHHWNDIEQGLREMRRVSRERILLLTWIGFGEDFWLLDYLPEIGAIDNALFPSLAELEGILGNTRVETVEIPHDCTDGFMCAYWRRPEMYLDAGARRAISTFSRLHEVSSGLERLRKDLESGQWRADYGHLMSKESLDCGYRLVIYEADSL